MPRYLRPTAPIHPDVLLPADPGLAMALAQATMAKPLMANHHHGLWGYSGTTGGGRALTVQASGIGGPSAAAVVSELATHGARRVIRLGRCAALDRTLRPGAALVVREAVGADGVCAALGAPRPLADVRLAENLAAALGASVATVASTDLAAAAAPARVGDWEAAGARAVDLETAAVLAIAATVDVAATAVVVVEGDPADEPAEQRLHDALVALGPAVAPALAGAR